MRSKRDLLTRILLGILIAAVLVGMGPADFLFPVEANELDDLQKEFNDLQRQMEEMLKKLNSTKSTEKKVLSDLSAIESQLNKTRSQLNKLENDIDYLSDEITVATSDLADAEEHLAVRQDYLSRRVRAIYEGGTVAYIEVLLGSTSFADFLNRYELLQQIIAKDNELFHEVKEERAAVAKRKAELEAKKHRALSLQAQATARKASIEYQQSVKERYLSQVRNDKRLYEQAIDELEETSRQLEAEIRKLNPWGTRPTGKLLWPATSKRITSNFGMRFHPILKTYRPHTGIDIGAGNGTKVFAAEWGIVRRAEWLGGYGNAIMIDHGGGIWTLYAHLSKISVKVGQTVSRGEVVGLVGSTGWSTGPHLHFEVRDNGTPVNPLNWLPK